MNKIDDFDSWWKVYPRKLAKADARKAWKQTAPIRPPAADLIKAVIVACRTDAWIEAGGKYIPYAATWLRGERWADVHEIDLADVVNGKMWYETVSGVEAKGRELGILPTDKVFDGDWQRFRVTVMAKTSNVVKIA